MSRDGAQGALPPSMRFFERGWLSSNNILFLDEDGTASLVDTGYVSHAPQTEALLDAALAGRPLTRILNTHLHSDHCGGNAHLAARFKASIWIPPGSAEAVSRWDADALTFAATGQRCPRFAWQQLLEPGATVRLGALDWEVLAAPGHDPHSVVLWCAAQRLLISADALWETGFGVIFPELEGESGFAEQQAVLEHIERLAPRVVVPGHGAPFAEVGAALERAQRRLESFRSDPVRNARHASRVLIKFWLLDVRSTTLPALHEHFARTEYLQLIHRRYFAGQDFAQMIDTYVGELVRVGAAEFAGGLLHNRD
jgi:glyoxylase-like metal-dependent hydrolase (beta-lactamase superfamily II)